MYLDFYSHKNLMFVRFLLDIYQGNYISPSLCCKHRVSGKNAPPTLTCIRNRDTIHNNEQYQKKTGYSKFMKKMQEKLKVKGEVFHVSLFHAASANFLRQAVELHRIDLDRQT